MTRAAFPLYAPLIVLTSLIAINCDDEDSPTNAEGGETGELDPLACEDELILDLGLVDNALNEGLTTSSESAGVWTSTIDATSGGFGNSASVPWLYLRFTPTGLEKLDLDDLEALESSSWHIAAKRFGIRLNSGSSGPSSVSATSVTGMPFEDLNQVPAGVSLEEEDFYRDDCSIVDDGSGLGSPNYQLSDWWTYPGCVATTFIPFVIELPDGQSVKLVVDSYYESGQDSCNADPFVAGEGSGTFVWRWAFLP